MKCQHCGAEISDQSTFCVHCGARVADQAPQNAPQPPYEPTGSTAPGNHFADGAQPRYQVPPQNPVQPPMNGYPQPPQPKKKGKTGLIVGIVIAAVLVVLAIIGIVLIVNSAPKETASVSQTVSEEATEAEEPVSQEESAIQAETEKPAKAGDLSIPETTLLDQEGVTATATGITMDGFMGPEMDVTIENTTDLSVYVTSMYIVVNGYTLKDAYLMETVAAGKTANGTLQLDEDELNLCGIETITDISVQLRVVDDESYDTIADGDFVSIETSLKGTYEQKYDDSGVEVCNESGIRVVGKQLYEEEYYDGSLLLYVENNTDQAVTVTSAYDSVSINGVMANESFYVDMAPNSHAVVKMYFYDLESIDIASVNDITEMELVIEAYDSGSYDDLMETDPITLTFE